EPGTGDHGDLRDPRGGHRPAHAAHPPHPRRPDLAGRSRPLGTTTRCPRHPRGAGGGSRMNLTESVRVALRALGANKLRASLTMLGMIIGVGAVIALMSIGKGVQASVTSQIKGLGTNLLFFSPGAQTQGGVRGQAGTAPTLTYDDAQAIVDSGRVPQVAAVA